ncbi:helix-turn-helix domain-containing protein [Mailhella massiliensis]|uniref:helix-turn-helix transcriptional regulator n=1 Tax=Mailhella massiliensis TaxID=1903261 RepID=UPI00097DAD8D
MEKLYSASEIAELCRVKTNSVRRWARQGILPKGKRLSAKCTRWSDSDVREFLRSRGLLTEEAAPVE